MVLEYMLIIFKPFDSGVFRFIKFYCLVSKRKQEGQFWLVDLSKQIWRALIGSLFIAIFYYSKGYFCIILDTAIKNSQDYSFLSALCLIIIAPVNISRVRRSWNFTGPSIFFTGHDRRSDRIWLRLHQKKINAYIK